MNARLRGPKSFFTKLLIKPYVPSLADEIAEPHSDMYIIVAPFTVSEKSSNIILWFTFCNSCCCAPWCLNNFSRHIDIFHLQVRYECLDLAECITPA